MQEYLGNGKFLCDRRPIPVSVRNSDQKQLQGQQNTKKRLQLKQAQALDKKLNSTGVFEIGSGVRLSPKGREVDDGYDWGEDPLRPGEVGDVQEPTDEDADLESCEDLGMVFVVGPRGDSAFYDPLDLELVHECTLTNVGSWQLPVASKAADSTFYNLKFSGTFATPEARVLGPSVTASSAA